MSISSLRRSSEFAGLLALTLSLSGLLIGCQPRNIIPAPTSSPSGTVAECSKTTICGQCVSNARCGWCGAENRCVSVETAQSCSANYIAKDPEQTLCPPEKPAQTQN